PPSNSISTRFGKNLLIWHLPDTNYSRRRGPRDRLGLGDRGGLRLIILPQYRNHDVSPDG
ncbi:MAG: hypothetical protein M1343_13875, partial [Chloroflexi bacterium]|nr:hypothetical protein [Chloroflexota bacterium]